MAKVLVIGGPGNISASLIQDLLERGDIVGLFSRPESLFVELDSRVKVYPGDRDAVGELESAFDEFLPDVFVDLCCFTPAQAERVVRLTRGKIDHFIFASTVDVYGYPLTRLPFRETDTWRMDLCSVYASDKLGCEVIFNRVMELEEFPLTIVRPSYSFGARFILSALDRAAGPSLLYRLANELPILVPGDGTTLIHVSSGFNTGRMVASMVGQVKTIGQDYTCAHPTAMEYREYVDLFSRQLGKKPVLVNIPTEFLLSIQCADLKNSLLAELTRYNLYFSIDKFLGHFPEFEFESLDLAAKRAVDWNFRNGKITYYPIIDDRIIEAYQKCLREFFIPG